MKEINMKLRVFCAKNEYGAHTLNMEHIQDTGTKGRKGWTLPLAPRTSVSELIEIKAQGVKVASTEPFIYR